MVGKYITDSIEEDDWALQDSEAGSSSINLHKSTSAPAGTDQTTPLPSLPASPWHSWAMGLLLELQTLDVWRQGHLLLGLGFLLVLSLSSWKLITAIQGLTAALEQHTAAAPSASATCVGEAGIRALMRALEQLDAAH